MRHAVVVTCRRSSPRSNVLDQPAHPPPPSADADPASQPLIGANAAIQQAVSPIGIPGGLGCGDVPEAAVRRSSPDRSVSSGRPAVQGVGQHDEADHRVQPHLGDVVHAGREVQHHRATEADCGRQQWMVTPPEQDRNRQERDHGDQGAPRHVGSEDRQLEPWLRSAARRPGPSPASPARAGRGHGARPGLSGRRRSPSLHPRERTASSYGAQARTSPHPFG